MKTSVINRTVKIKAPAFPNAADRHYYLQKLLDGALMVAITAGTFVALVFLLLL